MMMWTLSGRRDIFLDVVTRVSRGDRLDLRQIEIEKDLQPRQGEITLVWHQPPVAPLDLPEIIIGDQESLEDFVAWANTNVRGLGTISSNCRLLLRNEISLLSGKAPSARLLYSSALAGLIVAEVLALSDATKSIGDIGVSACLSTFAFACARAQFLGHPPEMRTRLAEQWERAHRLTNPTSAISSEVVQNIIQTCSYVMDYADSRMYGAGGPGLITSSLPTLAQDGEISARLLSDVLKPFDRDDGQSRNLNSMLSLTPTDRVRIFDDLSPIVTTDQSRPRMERAFALAILASACRPGTLQHFALLRHPPEIIPEAVLWFGLIQGLHRQNDVLESADGLGRRVLRELLQKESIADRPRSDISLLELDILARGNSLRSLRTNSSSYISIEIAPGVYTLAKRQGPSERAFEEHQKELALQRDRDAVEELEVTLRYAANLVGEIRRQSRNGQREDTRRGKRWRK